jgi:hypothetical protein
MEDRACKHTQPAPRDTPQAKHTNYSGIQAFMQAQPTPSRVTQELLAALPGAAAAAMGEHWNT